MDIKTKELDGLALDYMVAKANSWAVRISGTQLIDLTSEYADSYSPSTDWSQGGPLLSEYKITIETDDYSIYWAQLPESELWSGGDTHLIAACRALVASKLGDEVDVPYELLEGI